MNEPSAASSHQDRVDAWNRKIRQVIDGGRNTATVQHRGKTIYIDQERGVFVAWEKGHDSVESLGATPYEALCDL